MKLKTQRYIAIWMIYLVLSITFFSTAVLAQMNGTNSTGTPEMDILDVQGLDGISGVLHREDDELTVDVAISGLSVTTADVQYQEGALREDFTSCSGSTCTYTSVPRNRASGKKTFKVVAYDSLGLPAVEESGEYVVDGTKPSIISFVAGNRGYVQASFNVTYDLQDFACDGCTECSGFDRLEIYKQGTRTTSAVTPNGSSTTPSFTGETITLSTADCTVAQTATLTASGLDLDGTTGVCIRAYDRVGNFRDQCQQVKADSNPPAFIDSSFEILDSNGDPLAFISSRGTTATVKINVTEQGTGLNTAEVVADFSGIGGASATPASSCTSSGTSTYVCEWNLVPVKLTGNSTTSIGIIAKDNAGNKAETSVSAGVQIDGTPPVVSAIKTSYDGFLNIDNNTITVTVTEDGSGMDLGQVYLDLSELGLPSNIRTNGCTGSSGLWDCTFTPINPSTTSGATVAIKVAKVVDDAGNLFIKDQGVFLEEVIYDGTPPTIINAIARPFGVDTEVVVSGLDILEVVANITESETQIDPSNSFIDLTGIAENTTRVSADACDPHPSDASITTCVWSFGGFMNQGDFSIPIVVHDAAGNRVQSSRVGQSPRVTIVALSETEVDFWLEYIDVGEQPKLNRNFLWLSTQGTVVRLDAQLEAKGAHPHVHALNIRSCQTQLISDEEDTGGTSDSGRPSWLSTRPRADGVTGSAVAITGFQVSNGTNSSSSRSSASATLRDAPIVNQLYLPDTPRDQKTILINVQNYKKNESGLETAEKLGIVCQADVQQSRSSRSAVYSPNEQVTFTAEIEFLPGTFSEPGAGSVDAIRKNKDFYDDLTTIIDFLQSIIDLLGPICQILSLVRQILSGVCTILALLAWIPPVRPAATACAAIEDKVNDVWTGETFGGGGHLVNKNSILSIGFVCDLVLCESCGDTWDAIGGGLDVGLDDSLAAISPPAVATSIEPSWAEYTDFDDTPGLGSDCSPQATLDDTERRYSASCNFNMEAYWDPHSNIIPAIICIPPCLPGIQAKLSAYREIIRVHNICVNTATVRGESTHVCSEYLTSQICQQIVGEIWSFISNLITQFVSKTITMVLAVIIERLAFCPEAAGSESFIPEARIGCFVYRLKEAVFIYLHTVEVIDDINALKDQLDGFGGDSGKNEMVTEEVENAFGEFPEY